MPTTILPQDAAQLKAEADALFANAGFSKAIKKYAAAIKIVPDNAILYSNRSACYIRLQRYDDARKDAEKAIELDKTFARAWGRLGEAFEGLEDFQQAKEVYGKAIEHIDCVIPLSDMHKKLRLKYKACFVDMEGKLYERVKAVREEDIPRVSTKQLSALPMETSEHMILETTKALKKAVALFKSLKMISNNVLIGERGGIEFLCDAILLDERCIFFDIKLCDFFQMYKQYVEFECCQCKGWINVLDPHEVLRLAKQRLAETGRWESIRDPLSFQVRAWIILGFIGQATYSPREDLVEWYSRSKTLIKLVRQEWPDIPSETRGSVFDDVFLNAVQIPYMKEYRKAYEVEHLRKSGEFTLDGLMALANEILAGLDNRPATEAERATPAFYLPFFAYPRAQAMAAKAYVYASKREYVTTEEEKQQLSCKAGDAYMKSADLYPEDDEMHCLTLHDALHCYLDTKITVRDILKIMERIRVSYPKMRRIWSDYDAAFARDHKSLGLDMEMEEYMRNAVATGTFQLDMLYNLLS
ncbi:hypothetical protein M422DRAFT_781229 [Sphaerobolus stellatus SS14]|uniref:Uncharacterized protein n=1 Tax=Sphaerobolus stellatus (strain SS14) TaxID=990650 RepID=A0A0C9VMN2_SPHS4|nr:hypothetical protein M422DRAFT_781229 [Sphaerobolus stellatus SS14]